LPNADTKQWILQLGRDDHLEDFQRHRTHNLKIKLLVDITKQQITATINL